MGKYLEKNLKRDEQVILKGEIAILPHLILMCVIIGFFTIWKPLFARLSTDLGFTNKRIVGKTGIINTEVLEAPLNKIDNVFVSSGLWGKIFGYGDLVICTNSGRYAFNSIAKVEKFRAALMSQIDQFEEERVKKQAEELAQAMKNNSQSF